MHMKTMKKISTRTIAGTGLLLAIMIVLQIIANYVSIGPVSINLSLIPIAIASIIYGPLAGLLLGFVDGILCIFTPSTMAVFIPVTILGTIITCLVKTSLAGLLGGFIYLLIHKKNETVAIIVTSILLPILNTLFFAGCALIFFRPILEQYSSNGNIYSTLFLVLIGWNFVLEFTTCAILSPVVVRLVKYFNTHHKAKTVS